MLAGELAEMWRVGMRHVHKLRSSKGSGFCLAKTGTDLIAHQTAFLTHTELCCIVLWQDMEDVAAAPGPGSYSPKLPIATAFRPASAPLTGSAGFPFESGAWQHKHNHHGQYIADPHKPDITLETAEARGSLRGSLPPHKQHFGRTSGRNAPGGLFSSSRSSDNPGPGSYEPLASSSTFCQYHFDQSRQSASYTTTGLALSHTPRNGGSGSGPCFDSRADHNGDSSSSSYRNGAGSGGISSSFVSKVARFAKPASATLKPGPGEKHDEEEHNHLVDKAKREHQG
jgi:hypothetical protein